MERKRMDYDTFVEMVRQRYLGVSARQICKNIGISRGMIERWWHKGEDEFLAAREQKISDLEQYREFVVSLLAVYPQIRATNVFFKIKENFSEFDCKRATFFNFFAKVRNESGYAKYKERLIPPREQLPPGYEAQVDFGQYKLKDMYGQIVRVYFFAIVLSYSQMKFAYFARNPFTTATAIYAHELAFKFFNGRTQTIMYDLDRVFVVNENYGDIVYVKEFEDFVRKIGYSTTMCRPRDPRTKGRVEALIGYIKGTFLEGRIYAGIDSLNSACLMWMDNEGNGIANAATRKIPREMFREESKYHIPVTQSAISRQKVLNVTHKNSINYNGNEYAMPKGMCEFGDRVRVAETENTLTFYKADANQFICNHTLHLGEGNVITLEEAAPSNVSLENIRRTFGNDARLNAFLDKVHPKRYLFAQSRQIDHLTKYYTDIQVMSAIEYCLRADKCNATELAAYLIYKFGVNKSRRCFSKEKVIMYSKRADNIKEELNGGY